MGADHQRRVIGYFTGWRTGKDGTPAYLASDIPWDKVTHLNYAFAHIDGGNKISVGTDGPANPATGPTPTPGACTAPAWTATSEYGGGSTVSHKGHSWKAKWWTKGEEPGTPANGGLAGPRRLLTPDGPARRR
ncbi:hypothetical protein SGLAM104S_02133 [Streptomyces glaucescens]